MKKYIKISVIFIVVAAAVYHSFNFEKLNSKMERESLKNFNPRDRAAYFWENALDDILKSAMDLRVFDSELADHSAALIKQYGKSIGITSTYSFLVKGTTIKTAPDLDEIPVQMQGSHASYSLQTRYIFGNAARDATGYFSINDFENTMDFNTIATELNKLIVQREIVKLDSVQSGETIQFVGALEINAENIPQKINIIPLKIEVAR